jgi:O-antigen/teichoic acid export membrane protein
MVRNALRFVTTAGIFAATGTVIFAPLIVNIIYGKASFANAAVDLRVLSAYVLLVYTSVVLGNAIAAARLQFRWAIAQTFCLLVSLVLDPLLIPWFEAWLHNGSLGVCVSVVIAEVAMVATGLFMLPAGSVQRSLLRTLGRSLAGAAAMAGAGLLLADWPVLAIPASVAAYGGVLWRLGEFDAELIDLARSAILKKTGRAQPEPAVS